MIKSSFWIRCAQADCTIIPVYAYKRSLPDGNIDHSSLIGLKYLAVGTSGSVVGPNYFFEVVHYRDDLIGYYDTPEAALLAYEYSFSPKAMPNDGS